MGLRRTEPRLSSAVSRLYAGWPVSGNGGTPSSVPSLAAWYTFAPGFVWQDSAGTTAAAADGDPIGRAADRSGSGRDLTMATAGSRPALKLGVVNGRAVARFGTSKLTLSGFGPSTFTLGFVMRAAAQTSVELMGWGDNSGAGARWGVFIDGSGNMAVEIAGAGRAGAAPGNGTATLFLQTFDNTDISTGFVQRKNGSADTTGAGSGSLSLPGTPEFRVGAIPTVDANFYAGDLAEIVVYTRVLTLPEQKGLEQYFNAAYAVY